MLHFLTTLWRDESAQDMAEYGLLLSIIAVFVVAILITFAEAIVAAFQAAIDNM